MTVHNTLNLPIIPLSIGAAVPQEVPIEFLADAPSWVTTVVLAIWVAGWFADKLGKLPTSGESAIRDERLITLLVELTKKVDDLSHAVTELRIELAKKD